MKRVIWMDIGLEYKILETAMYSKSRKTNLASNTTIHTLYMWLGRTSLNMATEQPTNLYSTVL